jgi:TfoX/Sxy family transcriptional regulator of competence genes
MSDFQGDGAMPYSEALDARITSIVQPWEAERRKMFGGTCHLLKGNMMCGVYKDFLILRLGENQAVAALKKPGVKPFDITGKPMKGWVMVSPEGLKGQALSRWIDLARAFVESLPPKK